MSENFTAALIVLAVHLRFILPFQSMSRTWLVTLPAPWCLEAAVAASARRRWRWCWPCLSAGLGCFRWLFGQKKTPQVHAKNWKHCGYRPKGENKCASGNRRFHLLTVKYAAYKRDRSHGDTAIMKRAERSSTFKSRSFVNGQESQTHANWILLLANTLRLWQSALTFV